MLEIEAENDFGSSLQAIFCIYISITYTFFRFFIVHCEISMTKFSWLHWIQWWPESAGSGAHIESSTCWMFFYLDLLYRGLSTSDESLYKQTNKMLMMNNSTGFFQLLLVIVAVFRYWLLFLDTNIKWCVK